MARRRTAFPFHARLRATVALMLGENRSARNPLSFPLPSGQRESYKRTRVRRNALAITSTELALIAALAIIGLSRRPKAG